MVSLDDHDLCIGKLQNSSVFDSNEKGDPSTLSWV